MNLLFDLPEGFKLVSDFLTWEEWLYVIILPLAIVFAVTFYIGLERQNVGKAAGISAHVLVGLGALMISLVQRIMYYDQINAGVDPEGQRVIAQVVSGIGFIGAGVIMKDNKSIIHGITTAATLWFSALLGIVCGSGHLWEGAFFGLFVIIFITIRDLKRGFNPLKANKNSISSRLNPNEKRRVQVSEEEK